MKFSLEKKSKNSGIFSPAASKLDWGVEKLSPTELPQIAYREGCSPICFSFGILLTNLMNFEFCSQAFEKDPNPYLYEGGSFFRVVFKGGGHLQPCGWGGGSLNLFKWHHYECLNNPISSNLASCTACCCSINSSLGLTGGKPDRKITILVFILVLQFSFLIFSVILILLFLLTTFWLCCYCRMLLYLFQSMELGMC